VNRDFTADAPGEKMVGDITYNSTWAGWVYLATVIDCYTKAVVGWAIDDNYKTRSSSGPSRWPPATIPSPIMQSSTPTAAAITHPGSSPGR